jgi:hypothetical protein
VTWQPPHTTCDSWFACEASLILPHTLHCTALAPRGYISITRHCALLQHNCAMSAAGGAWTAVIVVHLAHRTFCAPAGYSSTVRHPLHVICADGPAGTAATQLLRLSHDSGAAMPSVNGRCKRQPGLPCSECAGSWAAVQVFRARSRLKRASFLSRPAAVCRGTSGAQQNRRTRSPI